ncbi:hypothetical protein [Hyphomicrobium sp.]|uniref:hypothetical protein n=1 Tax=Hyphomicrobium sp. TaxID=82 RepID=UPI002E34806E|nr:hypothetical protein [Hyphomicrobium sp.]HEX2840357.1 hypothetical protein [Hyphomicrobium sp.]
MLQDWLSTGGIALDFLGFILLLREWWLAFFHESAVIEYEKQRAWQQSLRHQQRTHASDHLRAHLDVSSRIQDEMADRSARDRHLATLKSRKRMFMLATVLIVTGSLLQLAGALPESIFSLVSAG